MILTKLQTRFIYPDKLSSTSGLLSIGISSFNTSDTYCLFYNLIAGQYSNLELLTTLCTLGAHVSPIILFILSAPLVDGHL